MKERHEEYINNIIEQNEAIRNNEELLESLEKKLKRLRIVTVIEFCIFLVIILYSCSAGLNQNTVVPSSGTEITIKNGVSQLSSSDDISEETDESDKVYSITVDKINIGVNKDYSNKDTELYKVIQEGEELTRAEAKELTHKFNKQRNTYYIKSCENVFAETYSTADNSLTLDGSLGLNDFEYRNAGGYEVCFVADDMNQGAEPYSDDIVGSLMWKDYSDDDHCEEGASFVFIYNQKDIDANTISQVIDDRLNTIGVPVGANRVSMKMHGEENDSTAFVDSYFFLSDIKPTIDAEFCSESSFYISDDYSMGYGFASLAEHADEHNRALEYYNDDCILTVNDETPDIHAVIINIDGFTAESWYDSNNLPSLEEDVAVAIDEGYHK